MLLGAAILGAVAAKKFPSLSEAMKALNAAGQVCLSSYLSPPPKKKTNSLILFLYSDEKLRYM